MKLFKHEFQSNTTSVFQQEEISNDDTHAVKPQKESLPPKAIGPSKKIPLMTDPFKIKKSFVQDSI